MKNIKSLAITLGILLVLIGLVTNAEAKTHAHKTHIKKAPILYYAKDGACSAKSTSLFKVTTVILIRHAEKSDSSTNDPILSTKGKQRANELMHIAGITGIKAIYTSKFTRTKETVEPLAQLLNLTPGEVNESQDIANDILTKHAGEVVLVVGHTNSIPEVLTLLHSDIIPHIEETEFDNLFILTIYSADKARLIRLKYGDKN